MDPDASFSDKEYRGRRLVAVCAAFSRGGASYFVKTINISALGGNRATICLQQYDGPCPLLAIANVLLLRNHLRIKGCVGGEPRWALFSDALVPP